MHGLATILVNIGVIIYEAVIAKLGKPVVMSGDCMLVKYDKQPIGNEARFR